MAQQSGLSSLTKTPATIYRFIFEARDELKKVSWPNRQTTVRYTIIVVAASLIVGAVTGGIDYLLSLLLERVLV
jgi:preprotein translocase SecE subunit